MSTIASKRRLRFGMNCAHCDNELIAPEWTEYRSERQVHHVWRCWKCDCCFETIVTTETMKDPTTRDEIFPPRLVA
jgi:RNase P subunit RPR2